MAIATPTKGPDYARLRTTLANSKTQTTNNALFQTVQGLITGVKSYQDWINSQFEGVNTSLGVFTNGISQLNAVVNNLVELASEFTDRNSTKFSASVINNSFDTVPSDVITVASYDTVIFDDGEMFNGSTGFVAPNDALYLVTGRFSFDTVAAGFCKMYLTQNGYPNVLGEFKYPAVSANMVVPICQHIGLSVGDTVEVYIDQDTGGDVVTVGALEMFRVTYS